MRGDSESMTVLRPKRAEEAVELYARHPGALPLAGGTDLMVLWNMGQLNGRQVLDLCRLEDWKRIGRAREGLVIGSLATHAQIQRHPVVRSEFPLLVEACATVGAAQIQNRGTLGGNIANASPAGDTFPALAVYEPIVRAVSPRGRRLIHFSEIFAGVKKTTLQPAELIESVEFHFLSRGPSRQFFRKVGTRAAQAISKVVGAGLLWLERGVVREARLALGSVAPTVRRLRAAESFLAGKKLDRAAIDAACALVERDISPIDDIRSTRAYRLRAARALVGRFLEGRL